MPRNASVYSCAVQYCSSLSWKRGKVKDTKRKSRRMGSGEVKGEGGIALGPQGTS